MAMKSSGVQSFISVAQILEKLWAILGVILLVTAFHHNDQEEI